MAAAQGTTLGSLGKLTELRQRIFFLIGALIVFRLGSFIPVPGVNPEAMTSLVEGGGGLLNMVNMFSGGSLSRFSVFALGVVPYISASIVVQMMGSVLPSLMALRKEGESGRRKMTMYTRLGTVGLAAFQAFGIAVALQKQVAAGGAPVVYMPGAGFVMASVVGLTAGTMFLMWLGEQITERGIGNGISMLIFAGIVAGLPGAIAHTLTMTTNGELSFLKLLMVTALILAVTAFVVFMERAQRRITVNYAKQGSQRQFQRQTSHLPLKINMAGVIPPIFATSLLLFPATAATWFGTAHQSRWLQWLTTALSPGEPVHDIVFAVLVIGFAFFYTAIVFNSQETADNLKRSGALIPGIRPGRATADYIDGVMTRLTGVGAVYIVLVCLVPTFMQNAWHVPFYFGGTSLLIVVVVVMDFTAQVQAHLVSHQYESLLKKSNLRRG